MVCILIPEAHILKFTMNYSPNKEAMIWVNSRRKIETY